LGVHSDCTPRPVDIGQEADRLGDLVQALQPGLRPDVAAARLDDEVQSVGAEDVVAILVEGLDVLVADRHLLLEAGVHAQLQGVVAHQPGKQHEHDQDGAPEAEAHRLEQAQVAGQEGVDLADAKGIEHGRALAVGIGEAAGRERRSPPPGAARQKLREMKPPTKSRSL
jgi:hypothetical protein